MASNAISPPTDPAMPPALAAIGFPTVRPAAAIDPNVPPAALNNPLPMPRPRLPDFLYSSYPLNPPPINDPSTGIAFAFCATNFSSLGENLPTLPNRVLIFLGVYASFANPID